MKKIILCLNLIFAFFSTSLSAAKGEVMIEKGDYFVVDTDNGYTVMERRSGGLINEGDKIVGNLNSYGFKDVYNLSNGNESRVYIEDYRMDEEKAIEMIYELGG